MKSSIQHLSMLCEFKEVVDGMARGEHVVRTLARRPQATVKSFIKISMFEHGKAYLAEEQLSTVATLASCRLSSQEHATHSFKVRYLGIRGDTKILSTITTMAIYRYQQVVTGLPRTGTTSV